MMVMTLFAACAWKVRGMKYQEGPYSGRAGTAKMVLYSSTKVSLFKDQP